MTQKFLTQKSEYILVVFTEVEKKSSERRHDVCKKNTL